jgi:hypothetical protein
MKKQLLYFTLLLLNFYGIGNAQDAFMGYDYNTTTYPLAWSASATTFNPATNKELIYSNSGGAVNSATVCNTATISNYQINSGTAYIEVSLTASSAASSIGSLIVTGSSNSTTVGNAALAVIYSNSTTFSLTSGIISVEQSTVFPASNGTWAPITITPPSGTKSIRIYRRIYYNSSTNEASTSSGTNFVQYGLNTTIRVASVATNVNTTMTTNQIAEKKYTFYYSSSNKSLNFSDFNNTMSSAEIEIYSLLGQKIYTNRNNSLQSNNSIQFNIEDIPNGVYITKLKYNDESISLKFIKN